MRALETIGRWAQAGIQMATGAGAIGTAPQIATGQHGDQGYFGADEPGRKVKKWKAMRRHPIVALGLFAIENPLRSATWRVACPDDPDRAKQYQAMLARFWLRFHRMNLKAIPFGFAPFEPEFGTEPGDGGVDRVTILDMKDLDPQYTTLNYTKLGGFNGLNNKPGHVEASTPLSALESFVFTHEREFGNLYGRARLANIEGDYDRLVNSDKRDNKVSADDANRPMIGWHPTDRQQDPETGQDVTAAEIIKRAMTLYASGGQVAIPNSRDDSGNRIWDIEKRFDADDNADKRQLRMDAKELRILRGLLVPDRVVTQQEVGAYSLVNKVWDIFRQGLELVLREIEEHIDRYILARLDGFNYPDAGRLPSCHLLFDPLVDERIEMAKTLLQAAFANPDTGSLARLAKLSDLAALFEAMKLPKSATFNEVVEELRDLPLGPESPLAGLDLTGLTGE